MNKKIWITGSSGSGKTTYSIRICKVLEIPIYHRDHITWDRGWVLRKEADQIKLIQEMTQKEAWVFDGNRFSASEADGRFNAVDILIHLEVNRFTCVYRVIKRFFKNRHLRRPDLAEGCDEDLDLNHLIQVMFKYPKNKLQRVAFFEKLRTARPEVVMITEKKELKIWLNKIAEEGV